MANKLNIKLQEWLDINEPFKGKFIGYKESRGGLGISRIDNDWHECDDYLIRFEDLLEALEAEPSNVLQANELLPHVSQQRELLTKFYRHLCEIAVIDSEYRTEYDIKTIPKKFSL